MLPAKTIVGLRAVSEALGIYPAGFDMGFWAERHSCGTTLCIFGHLQVLGGKMPLFDIGYSPDLAEWFSEDGCPVRVGDSFAAWGLKFEDWLFYDFDWPEDLRDLYTDEPVRAGQLAIERFIAERATPEDLAAAAELEKPTFAFDYGVPASI